MQRAIIAVLVVPIPLLLQSSLFFDLVTDILGGKLHFNADLVFVKLAVYRGCKGQKHDKATTCIDEEKVASSVSRVSLTKQRKTATRQHEESESKYVTIVRSHDPKQYISGAH